MTEKKKRMILFAIFLLLIVSCKIKKQDSGELVSSEVGNVKHVTVTNITKDDIQWHISVLASDSMQGRLSASSDEIHAAQYIKEKFISLGLKAFNDNYYQTFPIPSGRYIINGELQFGNFNGNRHEKKSKTLPLSSQNVVAYLETSDPKHENEYIVIGAHYDHIGTRKIGDSVFINNGADDNASGTAGLLEIAEKLRYTKKLKHNVIFAAFGSEELGLIGSEFFCDNPPVPIEKIKLMINMDMIGRMDSSKHAYIGTIETNDQLNTVVDVMKKTHPHINSVVSFDNFIRYSDHSSFYDIHVPVMAFTTGLHNAYHSPADTLGSINCEGEKLLLDFIYDLVISPAMDNCIRSFTSSELNP